MIIKGVYGTTYVTMKKTSVPLLCTIYTKSKVGTEFMKSFEIEAHLPPAKKKGRCQTVLGTYELKHKRRNNLSDTAHHLSTIML
jgi:hypothetical protein